MHKRSPGFITEYQKGIIYGVGAYLAWGFLPIYLFFSRPASPLEIIAIRTLWSLVVCLLLLFFSRQLRSVWDTFRDASVMKIIPIAAVLIMTNWLIYAYTASIDELLEASLGYFINPIISVLLGVTFLKEKLRPLQWTAVILCGISVVVMTLGYGRVPWIALSLALTFGLYALVKSRINRRIGALVSLSVETIVLIPFAALILIVLAQQGEATVFTLGPAHFWILSLGGVVTVIPLLLFGASAARLPLSIVGLVQFVSPIVVFLIAVFIFDEQLSSQRWLGFFLVWGSLIIFIIDSLYQQRKLPPGNVRPEI